MTEDGGANNQGMVFSIDTDGSGYRDLLDFSGSNGQYPCGDLLLGGSTLYGMTEAGGEYGDGTVFALNLAPAPEPSTLALLVAGTAGLAGYAWRRRGAARRIANRAAFDQQHAPQIQKTTS
jgi:uncharacterized repeat protein (TIGR03803 family)